MLIFGFECSSPLIWTELSNLQCCIWCTNIERSQNSCTALCNGHGAPIGSIQVFTNHTRGNKGKQKASTIFARFAAFHMRLSSRSDCSTYTSDESWLFWSLSTLQKCAHCNFSECSLKWGHLRSFEESCMETKNKLKVLAFLWLLIGPKLNQSLWHPSKLVCVEIFFFSLTSYNVVCD